MFFLRRLLITLRIALTIIFCCTTFNAIAAPSANASLESRITAMVNANNESPTDAAISRTIKILTPAEQLSGLCPDPELSIAGNNRRLTGNKTVIAQCGTKRKFIQITVQARGTWWTAVRPIRPGTVIQAEDIQSHTGSMERLPTGVIFTQNNIIGQTTTRSINRGQPMVEGLLRKGWAVVSGQEVDILATGEGFQIRIKGKALDSAAAGQPVRITTRSGQIVTGLVAPNGKVNINLKESF